MEVKDVLFMNRGEGESSYAQNSMFTQKVTSITMPVLEHAVQSLFSKGFHDLYEVFNAADLGCAAGPNTFVVISTIKESIEKKCQELNCQTPELQVYLNDLPGNDFNTLFKGLSRVGEERVGPPCFVMGAPGSFHGRLFPRNSLHLVHSSYSVHWLSQAPKGLTSREGLPLNKGKIYISKTSPPLVREAYLVQFQEDFTMFLNSRSKEVVPNGCMVLTLHGRQSPDPSSMASCYMWEVMAMAIAELVSQGLIDEDKLDSFNVPYYTPSPEEVKDMVEREGSFAIERIETFALDGMDKQVQDVRATGEKLAKAIRSFTESMISNQFGAETMDRLFDRFTHIVVADWAKESPMTTTIILVLSKIAG